MNRNIFLTNMPIAVLMPSLSPTMKEGKLVKWCKKEGDTVKAGDELAEVETDKATMPLEAYEDGILAKILVPAGGNKILVESPIAILLAEDEDIKALENFSLFEIKSPSKLLPTDNKIKNSSELSMSAPNFPIKEREPAEPLRVRASPLAKKIAAKQNIDLTTIKGSGPGGRIIKQDVFSVSASLNDLSRNIAINNIEEDQIIALTGMREVIAERLLYSKQNIPHFYLIIECNIDKLVDLRNEINSANNLKITINDFIIKAVALSIQKNPSINSSWGGDHIRQYKSIDISVAVGIENGLVTPIIRNADKKTLGIISEEIKELIQRAKINKLHPLEYTGGGITISNLGMFGIKEFSAIINPPQSCILAIGAAEQRPSVKEGLITISTLMNVTLSCDHRVVDGVVGANFLKDLKKFIENPLTTLL